MVYVPGVANVSNRAPDLARPQLALCLFGRFEARLGDQPLGGFEYNKVRALLAYLSIEAEHPQQRAHLAALLWGDLPESAARQNLSQALTRLRQALGDRQAATPFLMTTADTVRINPQALCEVDVVRFTELVAEAETHTHRGWHLCTQCATRLRTAVEYYTGDFLAQFYVSDSALFEEWALLLRQRLRLRMLSALERLVMYAEWRGHFVQAVVYAQRQAELEPLRDHGHRELMRLLALSGQRAAALAHYEHFRGMLDTELDAEPEPATTSLYAQLSSGEEKDALRRLASPSSELPTPPTPLIGRETEIQSVCEYLLGAGRSAPARVLTVTGAPGIGKTRLALAVGQALRFDYEDGVYLVELAAVPDATGVPGAIASMLAVTQQPRQTVVEAICERLQSSHGLLILDNFEHVLDAAPLVKTLVTVCPALTVLITSRVPLHLRAEQQYGLQPLEVPAADTSHDRAGQSEALRLFVERARAVRPEFALTAATLPDVIAICRRLDGLPLAIELIAPRLKSQSVGEILRQLDSRLSAVARGPTDGPARHRTLRKSIEWSYELLSAEEQYVFARLGVYSGGFTADAIQMLVGDTIVVLPVLETLNDASLIFTHESSNTTRYMCLQTIGEFALATLTARGELDCAQQRHADYFLALGDAALTELLGPNQAEWSARIAAEHDNLRAALRWAISHDANETALRIASGIWRFWWQRGFLREGSDWLEAALIDRDKVALDVQARALRAAGVLAMGLNEYPRSRLRLEESLVIARQIGATYDAAAAMTNLGLVLREQGDLEAACAYLEQSVALQRTFDNPRSVKFPLIILAGLHGRAGNIAQAEAMYTECLHINQEVGDLEGTANALYGIAWVANAQADYRRARTWCEDAMALYNSLDHQFGLGWCYYLMGDIARDQKDLAEALVHYRYCLSIWIKREDIVSSAQVIDDIAMLFSRLHQPSAAVRLMGAAQAMRERVNATLTRAEQAAHERVLATCREQLGLSAYRTAWSDGRALRPKQAVALALLGEQEIPERHHAPSTAPDAQADVLHQRA